jgi:hypothetical protein
MQDGQLTLLFKLVEQDDGGYIRELLATAGGGAR